MSEPGLAEMPPAQRDAQASLAASLASLRHEGAQQLDPARFHYMERLSQRMQAAPAGVRRILEGKLSDALADYGERFGLARQAAGDEVASLSARHPELARELRRLFAAGDYAGLRRLGAQAAGPTRCAPLAELNHDIRSLAQQGTGERLASDLEAGTEMKSLRRFRETWSRIAAEDQVDQAVDRGPENAGPLNSHRLVLRSLALMRELSPDYLRRFLSHLDALLWLDQANQKYAPPEAKPARRSRARK